MKAAQECGGLWYNIHNSICENLNYEMEKKYKLLDMKSSNIVCTKTVTPNNETEFYPRVINKTNIDFTDEEVTPLNKGLKYNLNHKNKHWLSNIALEAEAAITRLPTGEQEQVRFQVAHNLQKLYKQYNGKHTSNNGKGKK